MKKVTVASMVSLANSQRQNVSGSETTLNTDGSIAADWLWEKMAEIYGEQWTRENSESPSLMWKAALSKQSQESIKVGIAQTVNQGITWPPNLPKFIQLCEGPSIDDTESFYRFVERKQTRTHEEYLTRRKVGYQCRGQLPEGKAKKLWSETITMYRAQIASGEIIPPDPNAEKIESPEKMKESLTTEQRNQQLDRQIDEMISIGQKLIGPFKKRHVERKK